MSHSNDSWGCRIGTGITRRRVLTTGSTAILALVAGCTEEDTQEPGPDGEGDDESSDEEESDSDTDDVDEPDDRDDGDESEPGEERTLTVEETSFEVVSTNGGTGEQDATIDVDGETIRVEGTITGQNGCYTATLADATVDEGKLLVQIETYDDSDDDELCTQALIDIDYAAVVRLSREAETVSVEHDGEEIATE